MYEKAEKRWQLKLNLNYCHTWCLAVKVPFHSILLVSDLALDLESEDPFSLQMDSSDARFRITLKLHAVIRVNIIAKSNKCPFSAILVWDREWVNVARVIHGRSFYWLMSRTSETYRTHSDSGRRTLGRPIKRPEVDRTRPSHSISRGAGHLFQPSGPRPSGRPMEWKGTFRYGRC